MIVVVKARGGSGSSRDSIVSALARNSGPNRALRFRSNSTSSLPFAGRLPYSASTIARVLTVKSTTDWNVRMGGRSASRPSFAWARDLLLQCARDQ